MNVHFTFRHMEATEAIKEHITKKVEKFAKFVTYPLDVHVRLSVEKPYHTSEITVHAERQEMVAIATTDDLYEAIDLSVHKIESQLKKEREKRKGHKSARLAGRPKALKLATDIGADLPHREKKSRAR